MGQSRNIINIASRLDMMPHEKFKLWVMVLCVGIFACACYTGSAHFKYESLNKTIEYEREYLESKDDGRA